MSSALKDGASRLGVQQREVTADEAGLRLDRWFRRHYPDLGHGALERLLRTGQVRIDGARAKSADRVEAGQSIRVPPLRPGQATAQAAEQSAESRPAAPLRPGDVEALRAALLYRDDEVLVLNKPPGLAVQGGSGLGEHHLDAMLEALRFDAAERPRLVHRLDKDTSGVLVLARSARAAAWLARAFRDKSARKLYWALVAGVPKPAAGRIDLALLKTGGRGFERMRADPDEGKRAVTLYATLDTAGRRAAWLALSPLTGRTHQLRAHCEALGTPIVGDGKYGAAFLTGSLSRKLHLHARSLSLPRPAGGRIEVVAPLASHMRESWRLLGFDAEAAPDPFRD